MALNDINLSANNIEKLYRHFLLDESMMSETPDLGNSGSYTPSFLGQNLKCLLILVNQKEAKYLLEEELDFLISILSACKYSIADVAIVNCNEGNMELYDQLKTTLSIKNVILFNVNMASVGFPFNAPHYQVQAYDNIKLLAAPNLLTIKNNKEDKGNLWTCLQKMIKI